MTEMVDMEKLARIWRKMQDKRDELRHEAEAADLVIKDQQAVISAALLSAMNGLNADNLGTKAGIIKRKVAMKPSAADWSAVYRWIQDTGRFDLLHKRLSSAVVEEFAEANDGDLPPGINVWRGYEISVVKPGGKPLPKSEGSDHG